MFFFSSLSLIFLSVLELVINFNTFKKKIVWCHTTWSCVYRLYPPVIMCNISW